MTELETKGDDMSQVTIIRPVPTEDHTPAVSAHSSLALRQLEIQTAIIEKYLNSDLPLERLDSMFNRQKELMLWHAKVLFDTNLAAMQAKMGSINQSGKLVIRAKGSDKIIQETPFSTMADINDALRPLFAEFGFALMFTGDNLEDGRVRITGILKHSAGHEERTSWTLPQDTSGSKNAVQAFGSSQTYGRRYCAFALLNISSRYKKDLEIDDDGASAGPPVDEITVEAPDPGTVSDEQVQTLNFEMKQAGVSLNNFLKVFKITVLGDLPANRYDEAIGRLKEYVKQKEKQREAEKKIAETTNG